VSNNKQKFTPESVNNSLAFFPDLTVENINKFLKSNKEEKLVEEVKKITGWESAENIVYLQTLVNASSSYAKKNKMAFYSLYPVIAEKIDVNGKGADKLFSSMVDKSPDEVRVKLVDKIINKGFQDSLEDSYTKIIDKTQKNKEGNELLIKLKPIFQQANATALNALIKKLDERDDYIKDLFTLVEAIIESVKSDNDGASVLDKLVNKVKASKLSVKKKNKLFQKVIEKDVTVEMCPAYEAMIDSVQSDNGGAGVLNKLVNKVKASKLSAKNKNKLSHKVIEKDVTVEMCPAYEAMIDSVKSDKDGAGVLSTLVTSVKDSDLSIENKNELYNKVLEKCFTKDLKRTFELIAESAKDSTVLIKLVSAVNNSIHLSIDDDKPNFFIKLAGSASKLDKEEDAQAVFSELLQNATAVKNKAVSSIICNFALSKAECKIKTNSQTGAKFTLSSLSAFMSAVVLMQNALVSAVAMGVVGGFMLLTHLICFLIERANPAKAWVQYVMPILEVGLTALVVYYLPALLPLAGFSLVMSPQMWLLMVPVGASCLTRWLCQFSTSDSQLNTAYNNVLSSRAINKDSSIQTADTNNISEDLQTLMDNCLTTKTSIK
jgi:hypothetical protein